jgi:hypothetical protein
MVSSMHRVHRSLIINFIQQYFHVLGYRILVFEMKVTWHLMHECNSGKIWCIDVLPFLLTNISCIMEEAGTSETSVNFYQTTWDSIPEDSQPQVFVGVCTISRMEINRRLVICCFWSVITEFTFHRNFILWERCLMLATPHVVQFVIVMIYLAS